MAHNLRFFNKFGEQVMRRGRFFRECSNLFEIYSIITSERNLTGYLFNKTTIKPNSVSFTIFVFPVGLLY